MRTKVTVMPPPVISGMLLSISKVLDCSQLSDLEQESIQVVTSHLCETAVNITEIITLAVRDIIWPE